MQKREFPEIEKAAAELDDERAGWVTRRDGANALGQAGLRAIEALKARAGESDVDVRGEVERTLAALRETLQVSEPAPAKQREEERSTGWSLDELVRHCEKQGERIVTRDRQGYVVDVTLESERHQLVHVEPLKDRSGIELVRVWTTCGMASAGEYVAALRINNRLAQCALALDKQEDGSEMLILVNTFIATEVTPREMKASVKEIARCGDWVEKRLHGKDAH